ncbi:hypothetical protein GGF46_001381 [Coemansia sp. RSA 552]|nr:hypothetical protein GGF46_001381 [Coemansia sp. RSA 552]
MVVFRHIGLLALLAVVVVAADDEESSAPAFIGSPPPDDLGEADTESLHTNTGHIIFQSMTATAEAASAEDEESSESSESVSGTPTLLPGHEKDDSTECMARGVDDWDQGLQVGGVFLILGLSFLGALLPIGCRHLQITGLQRAFAIGKFFGAGVILATAFVHMLGAAIETLSDSCLDDRMGNFDSWPALIAMLAVLAMHLMEHVLSRRIARNLDTGSRGSSSSSASARIDTADENTPSLEEEEGASDQEKPQKTAAGQLGGHIHSAVFGSNDSVDERRRQLSTYVLELGIALHSVIIGMTLAVTGGGEFKTLLAAISFHQFFEGLALGTRISVLRFRRHPLLMCLLNASIFALTTPLGQVIGIGIRQTFAPRDPQSLLIMGVLDSLSAGILMYSAIVNILVEEFASREFVQLRRPLRIACFAALYLGCAAMAIIGRWA